MGKSKPVTIGTMRFKTRSAANAYISELLNSLPLMTVIPEPHHTFLSELLAKHPRAAEKIGAGIKHFTVEPAAHGTHAFYVTRVDGTRDDFATGKCVRETE